MNLPTDFKLSINDVKNLIFIIIPGVVLINTMNNKLDATSALLRELKSENKEDKKEQKIVLENTINKVDILSIEVKVLAQRVSELEKKK